MAQKPTKQEAQEPIKKEATQKVQEAIKDPQTMRALGMADLSQQAEEMANSPHEKARKTAAKINTMGFILEYLKSPEDALLLYDLPEELHPQERLQKIMQQNFDKYVKEVADATGADPAQIADKNRRTPEQDKALTEAAGRETMRRLDAFMHTNYMQAMNTLGGEVLDLPELPDDIKKQDDADTSIKQFVALYFFSLHEDKRPQSPDTLTEKDFAELKQLFARFIEFAKQQASGPELYELIDSGTIYGRFIEADYANADKVKKALPRVMGSIPKNIEYPIDKINANVWDLLAGMPKNNNGQIAFATEKRGSKKEATVLYSIDFDELEKTDNVKITKQLTPFDKRVYIGVYASFIENGPYMSAGQIYTNMGNTGKPSAADIQKINDSLTKMGAAHIYLDNSQEVATNKGYPKFKYDASLLPFERVSAYINNALCESAIHIFREPPLMSFARERKQITSISRKLLESPISKTDANLRIDDYLIERIARMKSGSSKSSHKILYATVYDKCKITTKKQRQRAPEKVKKYLDFYKSCGWIKAYKEDETGIVIEL